MATKRIKYLGKKLTKEIKDLYTEKPELLEEVEEETKKHAVIWKCE